MTGISRLGHVGLYCEDVDVQVAFYRDVLGLTVTDGDPERGVVFLSARPDEEHHELLLMAGRNVGREAQVIQQLSFRCASVHDVIDFYRRFRSLGVTLDVVVSHGNAIGVYFYDPEGNRCEVYWATGLAARQPYVVPVDLEQPVEGLLQSVAASVERYGDSGILDRPEPAPEHVAPPPASRA